MKYEYEIMQIFINMSGVCVSWPSPVSACMSSVIVAACRVLILPYLLTGAWDMGPSVLEVPQNKKPCSLHFLSPRRCRHRTVAVAIGRRVCVCGLPPHEELA